MHLRCPSGIAGNLFATCCTRLGVPGQVLADLPARLGLPPAFQVSEADGIWDGYWDAGTSTSVIGGPVEGMSDIASDLLPGKVGRVAAAILHARWRQDPQREAFGETWCDTLFDAAAAAVCLDLLGWPAVTVHGPLPREAAHPVAARILAHWTWTDSPERMELVTPTGAAILAVVATQTSLPLPAKALDIHGHFTRLHHLAPLQVAA